MAGLVGDFIAGETAELTNAVMEFCKRAMRRRNKLTMFGLFSTKRPDLA